MALPFRGPHPAPRVAGGRVGSLNRFIGSKLPGLLAVGSCRLSVWVTVRVLAVVDTVIGEKRLWGTMVFDLVAVCSRYRWARCVAGLLVAHRGGSRLWCVSRNKTGPS